MESCSKANGIWRAKISYLSVEGGLWQEQPRFYGAGGNIASLYRCAARYMNNPIEQMDGPYLFAHRPKMEILGRCVALHEFCNELAQMLLNIQCLFDPEKIAIGGESVCRACF